MKTGDPHLARRRLRVIGSARTGHHRGATAGTIDWILRRTRTGDVHSRGLFRGGTYARSDPEGKTGRRRRHQAASRREVLTRLATRRLGRAGNCRERRSRCSSRIAPLGASGDTHISLWTRGGREVLIDPGRGGEVLVRWSAPKGAEMEASGLSMRTWTSCGIAAVAASGTVNDLLHPLDEPLSPQRGRFAAAWAPVRGAAATDRRSPTASLTVGADFEVPPPPGGGNSPGSWSSRPMAGVAAISSRGDRSVGPTSARGIPRMASRWTVFQPPRSIEIYPVTDGQGNLGGRVVRLPF